MSEKFICPVCGFDGLKEPPYNKDNQPSYEVCPCCGFEFGFDSSDTTEDSYKAYRQEWITNGAKWFVPVKKSKDWDLNKQLENLQ